jgi:hypothetical protein
MVQLFTKNYLITYVVSYASHNKETCMKKLYPSAAAALQGVVADGQLLAVGALACAAFPRR